MDVAGVVLCEEGKKIGSVIYHIGDGWYYHRNQHRRGVLHLRCIFYTSTRCSGTAVLRRGRRMEHSQDHDTHQPDVDYADELALRRAILMRCRSLEYLPYRMIVSQERRRFNREVRSRVTLVKLRTAMRNARLSRFPTPAPQNLLDLTQMLQDPRYDVLTMTIDGEDNLYAGSVTDANGDHHVLFASHRMLNFMASVRHLHGDGTMKIVPALDGVQQVFVVVTTWRFHIIPLAWILMSSKTQIAYESVLTALRNQLPGPIRARTVITDYERGQQNAWVHVFDVPLQGCLWHLCRAFVKEAVVLGLAMHLRNTPEVKRIIKLCCALPLLPQEFFDRGFLLIVNQAMHEGRAIFRILRPFLAYIVRYWLSDDNRRMWMSVYGSYHRTNNACESHNKVLNNVLEAHGNIYLLICGLASLENDAYTDMLTLQTGRAASRQRRASAIANDRNLRALEQDLMDHPPAEMQEAILNFLEAAAYRLIHIVDNALDDFHPQGRAQR